MAHLFGDAHNAFGWSATFYIFCNINYLLIQLTVRNALITTYESSAVALANYLAWFRMEGYKRGCWMEV